MEIIFGLMLLFIITYLIFIGIDQYNQLKCVQYKFKFFELRDRLALLVMQGKIKENSTEYNDVIGVLNFHISAVEKMSVTRVISMLIQRYNNEENLRKTRVTVRRIENEEVAAIILDYMDVTYSLIRRNSKAQIICIKILSIFIERIIKSEKSVLAINRKINALNPEKALNNIKSNRDFLERNFKAVTI